jgi:hypothetical protein
VRGRRSKGREKSEVMKGKTNRLALLSHQLTLDKVGSLGDASVDHHETIKASRCQLGPSRCPRASREGDGEDKRKRKGEWTRTWQSRQRPRPSR